VWYKNLDRSFFLFVTVHAFDKTDRQANRQTAFSSLDCICIACSTVKMATYSATQSVDPAWHYIPAQNNSPFIYTTLVILGQFCITFDLVGDGTN